MSQKPILTFQNLRKEFPRRDGPGTLRVLDDLSKVIMPNEFVTLVGPSGCGKSTLFNQILGSDEPTSGAVLLDGIPVVQPGADRGIVYQKYSLFEHLTVLQNVMAGGTYGQRPFYARFFSNYREDIKRDRELALEYLRRVKLGDAAEKYPHELSGGMRQRVAIAQALFTKPRILLMDEPFGALDPGTRSDAQQFLLELWEEHGLTVLFITHSLEEAVYMGTRVLGLSQHWEHDEGPHRTDNGAKFVLDYDLSAHVHRRKAANMTFERYVSKFTPVMDDIIEKAMEPSMRQRRDQFHVGPPVDVLSWEGESVLKSEGAA